MNSMSASRLVLREKLVLIVAAMCSMMPPAVAAEWWRPRADRALDDVPALATTGMSGGATVPDGRVLPEGAIVFGFNNALEPGFPGIVKAENFQFGIGLLPFVELTGRLANYPKDHDRTLGHRDLSANVKVTLPRILRYQPDIAFGLNDLGGGAPLFGAKFIAVSESVGPLRLRAGVAHGEAYLNGPFGGADLAIGRSGLTLFLERNSQASFAGLRYTLPPSEVLGNFRLVATALQPFRINNLGGSQNVGASVGVNLVMSFAENGRRSRRVVSEFSPIWTPPPGYEYAAPLLPQAAQSTGTVMQAGVVSVSSSAIVPAAQQQAESDTMQKIQSALSAAGLERVRIGMDGSTLIVEFENHRFNQNEVDAIGIVLGVASSMASAEVENVAAVVKKANMPLYMIRVDRAAYFTFTQSGDQNDVKSLLTFQYRPTYSDNVRWINSTDAPRGYSRFRIVPSLLKFVGTDVGVLDYSLAADIQGFVPLWKGAELSTSFLTSLAESDNVAHGIFGYAQQRSGLKSLTLSQSFWLTDKLLNVSSLGKFLYDDVGIQNEMTFFTPKSGDLIRMQYTYLRRSDQYYGDASGAGGAFNSGDYRPRNEVTKTGSVSYLWNYQPLGISIETSYNRYVGKDIGPMIFLNRWFGDVQAQAFVRKSNLETRVGFGLAFPLTPRQGMRPGWSHLEGAANFPLRLETRYARKGSCNCITNGIVQEMPMVYSSSINLLNQGRIGRDYLLSQLQRMREAAYLYANLAH